MYTYPTHTFTDTYLTACIQQDIFPDELKYTQKYKSDISSETDRDDIPCVVLSGWFRLGRDGGGDVGNVGPESGVQRVA